MAVEELDTDVKRGKDHGRYQVCSHEQRPGFETSSADHLGRVGKVERLLLVVLLSSIFLEIGGNCDKDRFSKIQHERSRFYIILGAFADNCVMYSRTSWRVECG